MGYVQSFILARKARKGIDMEEKHCKWYDDEFCTNAKSPCVADYCPVFEYPELCKHREFDNDINVRSKDDTDIVVGMTDEEIIKALEEMAIDCPANFSASVLDLIHRLQSENERLTEDNEVKRAQVGLLTEQVEEMEIDIIKTFSVEYIYALNENMKNNSDIKVLASSLIAKGYRKGSDTAKEILQEAKVHFNEMSGDRKTFENWLCKRYGVEVE